MMRGFQVSFDLFGFGLLQLSDYGQYEGAFRLNLHDQWFPIVEVGYGKADHPVDDVTGIAYKTAAPYFYIALTMMIIGTQLFLTGFIGDLVSRSSANRNDYQIEEELGCAK